MNLKQLEELTKEHLRVGDRIAKAIEVSHRSTDREGDIKGTSENSSLKRALLDFRKLSAEVTKR